MESCDTTAKPVIRRRKAGKGDTPSGVPANNFVAVAERGAAPKPARRRGTIPASAIPQGGRRGGNGAEMKNDCAAIRETTTSCGARRARKVRGAAVSHKPKGGPPSRVSTDNFIGDYILELMSRYR